MNWQLHTAEVRPRPRPNAGAAAAAAAAAAVRTTTDPMTELGEGNDAIIRPLNEFLVNGVVGSLHAQRITDF